ncbi:hypothetical protein CHGG_10090 [Chaetomium globosum CBS 148.51]|uniref:Uncharacterized protein n=1 Tax=Chaetomium globosum (strain ATCC 6205 / CBS 148.51 / DSM 1962 / NBRC 6347 / NRRL 1970) TaxID=306901 RepID=Q2GPL4_CHAGB|nr:uncharacterized protein CHGG_10090 [Chaetomium globosum CBS 148.51]EAQ83686.1 hypothetical protein CHGG_10090 [Chaetomium globosum CBS 148.51]
MFFVRVENGAVGGVGRGIVKVVEVEAGVWKLWTVFTPLEEVKRADEMRADESELVDGSPEVLIVGAGQSGITAAARLKMLGISALMIDKNKAVGDNWRKRYSQLVLHDPVWYDHLPYIPFPDFWPVFTPKDKLGDWFESYANALELNVWTQTELISSSWDEKEKVWTVEIRRIRADGVSETKSLSPNTSSSQPDIQVRPTCRRSQGPTPSRVAWLCHSGDFPGARESGKGKKAVVVGACNSSMDICQDYVEKGYDVTVVQRSSTFVISSQSCLKVALGGLYEESSPPVEDSDIFVWGMPSPVLKSLQVDVTTIAGQRDKEILDGLEKAGFKVDKGPSDSGIFGKYLQRGGGYYIDVGGSKLIIDGKIKVKHGQEVEQVLPTGLKFADGSELEADEIVFATGYDNMRTTAKAILGQELPDKVGDIWGWDEEGEMRTIWTSSGHPGLWFHGGNLAMCRYYSRLVALQILAKLKSLE